MYPDFLNNERKVLVGLLGAAIKGEEYHADRITNINWTTLYNEADHHEILPLLYPVIAKTGHKLGIPAELLKKWHEYTLLEGTEQERNIIETGKILQAFSKANIPVIPLKGLVLRNLYPQPGLRTMCDIDIFVKPSDIDKAAEIIKSYGYCISFSNSKHVVFSHKYLKDIELHRSSVSELKSDNISVFEAEIWNRAAAAEFSGVKVLSLCPRDLVLFLLLHMASHTISGGFGLRQLSDLALALKSNEDELAYAELKGLAAKFGIEFFTDIILYICYLLFGYKLPDYDYNKASKHTRLVNDLVLEILDGGVFGNNEDEGFAYSRMIYYTGKKRAVATLNRFVYLLDFLLPGADKLDNRYSYAKKHRCLLPAAWIHRLLFGLLRKEMDFTEKLKVMLHIAPTEGYEKRYSLLRQLQLLD